MLDARKRETAASLSEGRGESGDDFSDRNVLFLERVGARVLFFPARARVKKFYAQ